jgi:MATE family multidrug resistance protein
MLSESIAFNVAAIMIGWLGAIPLAAHQIAGTMAGTTNMIPLGVGTALIIRMGNLLGAEENKRLACAAYSTILTTCIFMGCVGGVVILFSHYISNWFVDSAPVHHITIQLLIVMGFLQITDALYILSQSALRGLADIHFPTFINIFVYLGFGVGCAFLLGIVAKLQAPGIWLGLCLGSALNGILCFWRLRKKIAISLQT